MTAVFVSCLHLDHHHCIHSCYFPLLFHGCKSCC